MVSLQTAIKFEESKRALPIGANFLKKFIDSPLFLEKSIFNNLLFGRFYILKGREFELSPLKFKN
tara:strand:+ start:84 stop:278 length:195 start_codon:yes stop_codon:yes gene_type:complete